MCKSYQVLSAADRAVANTDQNSPKCDKRDLAPGWYRFQGNAGDEMPGQCVPERRCGTQAPGWLSGKPPAKDDGIVIRDVCYHWEGNCCMWKNQIRVRNCGDFYVYQLGESPECNLRYCGNAGAERNVLHSIYLFIHSSIYLSIHLSITDSINQTISKYRCYTTYITANAVNHLL